MLRIDMDGAIRLVGEGGYNRVAIQLPEGLKEKAPELAQSITDRTGAEVIILGEPCYGACDLADHEAKILGCDALLHFGHSPIGSGEEVPTHYIHVELDRDPLALLEENLGGLPRKIGLVTTVQHLHLIEDIRALLEESGFDVYMGHGKGRIAHAGQVLGCSFSTAREITDLVEGFLYVGTGDFHPLGVALSTKKPTLALDLELGKLRKMEDLKDRILRKRFAKIVLAADAESFGIILGLKKGQSRPSKAEEAKRLIQEKGRKAYLIALKEITPEALLPFRKLDAFVSTACPRVAIDDAGRYKRPLITPVELEIALGERRWEDYEMDEIG